MSSPASFLQYNLDGWHPLRVMSPGSCRMRQATEHKKINTEEWLQETDLNSLKWHNKRYQENVCPNWFSQWLELRPVD